MTTIGSNDARKHFAQLLERVARGEKILITRQGQAVAMLVPAVPEKKLDVHAAIQEMRELRKGVTLGPRLTIRRMIEEGRA
jgi:prevent-host-death family protein